MRMNSLGKNQISHKAFSEGRGSFRQSFISSRSVTDEITETLIARAGLQT